MIAPTPVTSSGTDPLIASLQLRHSIDRDVLDTAIAYREALQDQLAREIEVLKVARARLLNEQPG